MVRESIYIYIYIYVYWVVYKQFRGIRGELQGGVLEGFDLFFEEFSDKFPDEFSFKTLRNLFY